MGPPTVALMPQEEFEGDLSEAVFWGADLHGARFRDVDLTGTRISHALFIDVEVDATIDRVVINGVDVTDHVNQRDPWYPLRGMLRPADPPAMQAAWAALEAEWATTIEQARALPDELLHESVDGEWSFVQTLRHMVFAIDKWCTAPILGLPFDPSGQPNSGSVDFPWPGLDPSAAPSTDEALALRADRAARVADHLASVTPADLDAPVDVLENGSNPHRDCIWTVFEEAFWHNRYARRDLTTLSDR